MASRAARAASAMPSSPIWMRLPATRIRLVIAHFLYRALKLARYADRQRVVRHGIVFDVDISEGLGLSVFLFGSFQKHVTNPRLVHLKDDAVVVDVGANIGVMALRFAQLAPRGRIYAFEPTDYAFAELTRNLTLNPTLAAHVEPVKAFLSDEGDTAHSGGAYSSWRVSSVRPPRDAHAVHGGSLMAATGAPTLSLDRFCQDRRLDRLDFIKIDTDGHELEVLRGACDTLQQFLPALAFEAGLYITEERGHSIDEYFDLLEPLGYRLVNTKNGHAVTRARYTREIPLRATTDLLAIPRHPSDTPAPDKA